MADVHVLDVLLHGEPVGTLARLDDDRTLFGFLDAYVQDANRPLLGLGFKDRFGELITSFRPTRTRLLPYFSNLLPEGRLRTYLAERAGVHAEREFFLLRVLGLDLPGAVTIRSPEGDVWPPDAHSASDRPVHEAGDGRRQALRFSLAGVQLKFSAVGEARGGLTIPAKGIGGSWIVKLPSPEYEGVPENEYSMMTLAGLIGMHVPAMRLIDVRDIANLPEGVGRFGGTALAVERFDRTSGGDSVHAEDFAQVFGVYPESKYMQASMRSIARVVGVEGTLADVAEFIRRLTFNTLIGNADLHLKNWSLIYPDRRRAALAPAYDFVSTIAHIPDDKAALKFSRTKLFTEFSEDELSHLADRALLPERLVLDTARETVALFRQHWRAEKSNLPLAANVVSAIETHLASVPLARARQTRVGPLQRAP
ncbi:MAG: type II toxin-antitoxin system HipA family toxin [Acidobacteria bacterium]|nr:type II toxin-antitoxin system HipA family toxin [Acidobacteriota bacterium]